MIDKDFMNIAFAICQNPKLASVKLTETYVKNGVGICWRPVQDYKKIILKEQIK